MLISLVMKEPDDDSIFENPEHRDTPNPDSNRSLPTPFPNPLPLSSLLRNPCVTPSICFWGLNHLWVITSPTPPSTL